MNKVLIVLFFIHAVAAFIGRPLAIRFSPSLGMAKEKAEAIGKAELLDILKEKTGITKKDIETVLSALTASVREEVLVGGKEIRLRDFGTFKRRVSAARVGRNPRTGEELQIQGSQSVAFSVSTALKEKV